MVFQILLSDKQMKPLFDKERIPPKRRLCLGKWADIDPVIGIAEVIGDVDPGLGNVIVFLYVFEKVKDFLGIIQLLTGTVSTCGLFSMNSVICCKLTYHWWN